MAKLETWVVTDSFNKEHKIKCDRVTYGSGNVRFDIDDMLVAHIIGYVSLIKVTNNES